MSIRRSPLSGRLVSARREWPAVFLLLLVACHQSDLKLGTVERLTSESSRLSRYNLPYYVALAPLPEGGAIVAWMKDESPFRPIVFRRAERADAPFGDEQYLSPEAFRRTISIVPSLYPGPAAGDLYATWQARDPRRGDKYVLFRRSQDSGRTWSEARVLNRQTTDAFVPTLASDRDGGVYVSWPDERFSLQIYFNRSLDAGDTWLPTEVRIDEEKRTNAKDVVMATDDGTGVLMVWGERKKRRAIMAAVSKDRGATWSAPVQIDDGSGTGSPLEPQVAFAGGRMVVAWSTGVTGRGGVGEIWADVSSDGGLTWGKDVLLHQIQGGLVSSPQLLSDGRTVQLVFDASAPNRGSAVYHLRLGSDGEWSAHGRDLQPVSAGQGQFRSPRLARDASGVSFLVYTAADARVLLTSSKDDGARWKTPIAVYETTDAQKRVRYPQVAAVEGVAYVLWEEWSDSTGRIKTLAEAAATKELDADLFVRRVSERR